MKTSETRETSERGIGERGKETVLSFENKKGEERRGGEGARERRGRKHTSSTKRKEKKKKRGFRNRSLFKIRAVRNNK